MERMAWWAEAVEDAVWHGLPVHEAAVVEVTQMPAHRGYGTAQYPREVANPQGALLQEREDTEARPVSPSALRSHAACFVSMPATPLHEGGAVRGRR